MSCWEAVKKLNPDGSRDRLRRWQIIDTDSPGRGKRVVADNIRHEADAKTMAEAERFREMLRREGWTAI